MIMVLSLPNFVRTIDKLTGQLNGWWSCSVSYDCRIIFGLTKDLETGEDIIILLDIGSHDEVY
jgi:mRNA-degrading endonuclease YafQ of YafQ-DinJ toxin-antitoxin module